MTGLVSLERCERIGILNINNPPVNALSLETVQQMIDAFAQFEADSVLDALVIHCEGKTFIAGADITQFERPDFSPQAYNDFLARVEDCKKLVVATLHGTTLGAGLELALACHYRIAVPPTKLGLPEVKLGVLPGSLGTQRLPRLAGPAVALDLIQSGRTISAALAHGFKMVDEVSEGNPKELGVGFAKRLLKDGAVPRRIREMHVDLADTPPNFFADALQAAEKRPQYPALAASVRCIQAASNLPFEDGAKVEAREFEQLRISTQSRALRHLFFAEREASKIPRQKSGISTRTVSRVGIVGAGTMGGGILMNFLNVGIPVVVVDASQQGLERGVGLVRKNYEASVTKGKLSEEQARLRMDLLVATLDYDALRDCDLVIEAVFEDMELKKAVCGRLGTICRAGAIIATNTSTLDVDQLAEATGRPEDVVGMHFFSPANVMRLLEVVRGARTGPDVLATVMNIAKRIGKTAVVSGVCYGFIGNRMGEVYGRETENLLLEGASPSQIDGVVQSGRFLGMAMGPCRMIDLAGVDVAAKTVIEWIKSGGAPNDSRYRIVCRTLFEREHWGQKTGLGYYRYNGRTPIDAIETAELLQELAHEYGVQRRVHINDQEILERLLYPMINEAARILEEGVAYRPSDIDVVWTAGYGFPDYQGGPIFMADQIGISKIVERLDHYAQQCGNDFGYWDVAPLMRRLAKEGKRLSDWTPAR